MNKRLKMLKKCASYKEYLKVFQTLNDPEKLTCFNEHGALVMFCDKKKLEYKKELKQLEDSNEKHFFEMKFIPFKDFLLYKNQVF